MIKITLSKPEAKFLSSAAKQGGHVTFPASMAPNTKKRLSNRLLCSKLIFEDGTDYHLAPTGFTAVGLQPPQTETSREVTVPHATKAVLLLQLLERQQGVSLADLTDATGWLPHTARAALSRVRSAGWPLVKSKREDGTTVYRIVID